ncbi:hypothetical protein ACFQ3N_12040 [Virgibacillus byunsanensis]|uniref:Uncharacterized protein n=1 Tax=Virgibacillus byunsanensis TaxID=570945 RepID=A0ABW3LL47_9BACI
MNNPIIEGKSLDNGLMVFIDLNRYPVQYVTIFIDNQLMGNFYPASQFYLPTSRGRLITIISTLIDGSQKPTTFSLRPDQVHRAQDYMPGDILVASDNYGDILPPGYMGHSALVVDENHIIEAVTSKPQVRKVKIDNFLSVHPIHAHYRSKDIEIGEQAAAFAKDYLSEYNKQLDNGEKITPFSFNHTIPLEDLSSGLYCSKLVWHSYYQGADILFENDFYLFAPEDLATNLQYDDRFELIYQHPEFGFNINL